MSEMIDYADDKGLPFNKKKQDALLGYFLTDPKAFMQARNLIQPSWFADPHAGAVFAAQLKWFDQYGRVATVEEMKGSSAIVLEEPAIRVKRVAKVGEAIYETANFKFDALSSELSLWLKARIFYSGVNLAQKDFNNERFETAYRAMEDSLKKIKDANFLREREESFSNWQSDLNEANVESSRGLTFGLDAVDNLLLPEHTHGALLPGDTTIILAPTNIGKTTSMLTTAMANVLKGKRVLFITHEGRPQDIKMKMRMCYFDASKREVFDMPSTDEGVEKLEESAMWLERYMRYVPYNKAGLCVEDVEPLIRRKQEELMAKNNGRGFDLLVCDYPAKLNTKRADGGHLSKRNIDEIVYGYFIQLALEYGFHALLAIQTNREGSRVNKGQKDERRLLTMEDVHESFGVMQEATNVITMNRDPLAKARQRLTYYIDKSRSSDTGFAVVARTNYAHAITHSNNLGCIWYRGVSTLADQVDDLLANPENNGNEIDATQF